jgi:hypothetical protein
VTLSGSVVVIGDENSTSVSSQLPQVSVFVVPLDPSNRNSQSVPRTAVDSSGNFKISGVRPGRIRLGVTDYPSQNFSVLRVELNDTDQSNGIDVRNSEVRGVRLVLTFGKGNVVGKVTTRSGQILTFRRHRLLPPSRYVGTKLSFAKIDAQGRHSLTCRQAIMKYKLEHAPKIIRSSFHKTKGKHKK